MSATMTISNATSKRVTRSSFFSSAWVIGCSGPCSSRAPPASSSAARGSRSRSRMSSQSRRAGLRFSRPVRPRPRRRCQATRTRASMPAGSSKRPRSGKRFARRRRACRVALTPHRTRARHPRSSPRAEARRPRAPAPTPRGTRRSLGRSQRAVLLQPRDLYPCHAGGGPRSFRSATSPRGRSRGASGPRQERRPAVPGPSAARSRSRRRERGHRDRASGDRTRGCVSGSARPALHARERPRVELRGDGRDGADPLPVGTDEHPLVCGRPAHEEPAAVGRPRHAREGAGAREEADWSRGRALRVDH